MMIDPNGKTLPQFDHLPRRNPPPDPNGKPDPGYQRYPWATKPHHDRDERRSKRKAAKAARRKGR